MVLMRAISRRRRRILAVSSSWFVKFAKRAFHRSRDDVALHAPAARSRRASLEVFGLHSCLAPVHERGSERQLGGREVERLAARPPWARPRARTARDRAEPRRPTARRAPLPLPMRVSSGFLVERLVGEDADVTACRRAWCARWIAIRAASIWRELTPAAAPSPAGRSRRRRRRSRAGRGRDGGPSAACGYLVRFGCKHGACSCALSAQRAAPGGCCPGSGGGAAAALRP